MKSYIKMNKGKIKVLFNPFPLINCHTKSRTEILIRVLSFNTLPPVVRGITVITVHQNTSAPYSQFTEGTGPIRTKTASPKGSIPSTMNYSPHPRRLDWK